MWDELGQKTTRAKIERCDNTTVFRKIQMYTKGNEAIEASSGRFLHAVPGSRVFIL